MKKKIQVFIKNGMAYLKKSPKGFTVHEYDEEPNKLIIEDEGVELTIIDEDKAP